LRAGAALHTNALVNQLIQVGPKKPANAKRDGAPDFRGQDVIGRLAPRHFPVPANPILGGFISWSGEYFPCSLKSNSAFSVPSMSLARLPPPPGLRPSRAGARLAPLDVGRKTA
jgi:hypothetical protein